MRKKQTIFFVFLSIAIQTNHLIYAAYRNRSNNHSNRYTPVLQKEKQTVYPIANPEQLCIDYELTCGSTLLNRDMLKGIKSKDILKNFTITKEVQQNSIMRDLCLSPNHTSFIKRIPQTKEEHLASYTTSIALHFNPKYARWFITIGKDGKQLILESCVFLNKNGPYKTTTNNQEKPQDNILCSMMSFGCFKEAHKGIGLLFRFRFEKFSNYKLLTDPCYRKKHRKTDELLHEIRIPARVCAYRNEEKKICLYPILMFYIKGYYHKNFPNAFITKLLNGLKSITRPYFLSLCYPQISVLTQYPTTNSAFTVLSPKYPYGSYL